MSPEDHQRVAALAHADASAGKCWGNCEEHRGPVLAVHVTMPGDTGHDWGAFAYCEEAVETDLGRGFQVKPLEDR